MGLGDYRDYRTSNHDQFQIMLGSDAHSWMLILEWFFQSQTQLTKFGFPPQIPA